MSSADLKRLRRATLLALLAWAPCFAAAAPQTHCHADEKPFFSCEVGKKTVSLCGTGPDGAISMLSYRYGGLDKVELEFSATSPSGPHFLATVEPVAPRAVIQQVWFDRGEITYLMHACEGGDCPYGGGLAVLRGNRVLTNMKCRHGPDSMDDFAHALIEFEDSTEHSKSHTPLIEIGDYGHPIDKLYPMPDAVYH